MKCLTMRMRLHHSLSTGERKMAEILSQSKACHHHCCAVLCCSSLKLFDMMCVMLRQLCCISAEYSGARATRCLVKSCCAVLCCAMALRAVLAGLSCCTCVAALSSAVRCSASSKLLDHSNRHKTLSGSFCGALLSDANCWPVSRRQRLEGGHLWQHRLHQRVAHGRTHAPHRRHHPLLLQGLH